MAYTLSEINAISKAKAGVYRQVYISDGGHKWIGNPDGSLRKIENKSPFETKDDVDWLMLKINNLELALQKSQDTGYTNFTYDDNDNIIKKEIYTDSTMNYKLFTTTYEYDSDGNLTTINVVRFSDSEGYQKSFSYDEQGNLHNINIR